MKSSVVQGVELQRFNKILISNMVVSKKTILTQGYELRWLRSCFLASVAVIEFHTVEAYSSLGLTGVRYNISSLSGVEKE
jgi:hypothetical protein